MCLSDQTLIFFFFIQIFTFFFYRLLSNYCVSSACVFCFCFVCYRLLVAVLLQRFKVLTERSCMHVSAASKKIRIFIFRSRTQWGVKELKSTSLAVAQAQALAWYTHRSQFLFHFFRPFFSSAFYHHDFFFNPLLSSYTYNSSSE